MKAALSTFCAALLFTLSSPAWAIIQWVDQETPASSGLYQTVVMADINKDGIPDVLAGRLDPDYDRSVGAGMQLWLGSENFANGRWNWSLAPSGTAKGKNATAPVAIRKNGSGIVCIPMTGQTVNTSIEDWVFEVIYPGEATISYFDDQGHAIDSQFFPYTFSVPEIRTARFRDGDIFTFLRKTEGGWRVTSSLSGTHPDVPPDNNNTVYYVPAGGEMRVKIDKKFPPNPPGGWTVKILLKTGTGIVYPRIYKNASQAIKLSNALIPQEYSGVAIRAYALTTLRKGNLRDFMTFYWGGSDSECGGTTRFTVGDMWEFRTPSSPAMPTTAIDKSAQVNDIVVEDFDSDGDQDIAAVTSVGLVYWRQKPPAVTAPIWDIAFKTGTSAQCIAVADLKQVFDIDNTAIRENLFWGTLTRVPPDGSPPEWAWNSLRFGAGSYFLDGGTWFESTGENVVPFGQGPCRLSPLTTCIGTKVVWSARKAEFESLHISPADVNMSAIVAADLDRDGHKDVVAASAVNGIYLFRYSATANRPGLAGRVLANIPVTGLALGDLNQDGLEDIVAVNTNPTDGVRVLLNGGYANNAFAWTSIQVPNDGGGYKSVALGDFNLDNFLDIAAAKAGGGIDVWYGRLLSGGNLTWEQVVQASLPKASANNQGDGVMSSVKINDSVQANTEEFRLTAVADADGNVVFNVVGTVTGSLGQAIPGVLFGSGLPVEFMIFPGDTPFAPGDFFSFITSRGPLSVVVYNDIKKTDVNNDGKLDLVGATSGFGIRVWTGNGKKAWVEESSPFPQGFFNKVWASTDFNRDGNPDIAGANNGGGVLLWVGDGVDRYPFQRWVRKPVGTGKYFGLDSEDTNQDGCLDMVGAHFEIQSEGLSVWTGNCAGTFTRESPPENVGQNYYASIFADVNNDGVQDIVASKFSEGIRVFLGIRPAQPGDSPAFADTATIIGTGSFWNIAANDFNQDGKLDIAATEDTGGLHVWLGNGTGTRWTANHPTFQSPSWGLDTADLNQDGYPDIAVGGHTGDGLVIYYWDSAGNRLVAYESYLWTDGFNQIYGVKISDFNKDGIPDIACSENGHGMRTLFGTGASPWNTAATPFLSGGGAGTGQMRGLDVADVNNDGNPDIAVASNGGGVKVYNATINQAQDPRFITYAFGGLASPAVTDDYQNVIIRDFTNDGLPDIAAVKAVSGTTGLDAWLSDRDFTPPKVSSTLPIRGGKYDIDKDARITVSFSETVDSSTVTASTFRVVNPDIGEGEEIPGTFLAQGTLLQFFPSAGMDWNITVQVTLTGGSRGILDLSGNGLDGDGDGFVEDSPTDDYVFQFTTKDTTGPDQVRNFRLESLDGALALLWEPSPSVDTVKYLYHVQDADPNGGGPPNFSQTWEMNATLSTYRVVVSNLTNRKEYWAWVAAKDRAGNIGANSPKLSEIPNSQNPQILMAGFFNSAWSASRGGFLTALSLGSDPNGGPFVVDLYVMDQNIATLQQVAYDPGLSLAVHSLAPPWDFDPNATDTGLVFPMTMVARDSANNESRTWPYLEILDEEATTAPLPSYAQFQEPESFMDLLRSTIERPAINISPDAPQIWLAGFWNSRITSQGGGTLKIMAYVDDPQGVANVRGVNILYGGVDTQMILFGHGEDTIGDFPLENGFWGRNLVIPVGAPVGKYFLELRAYDAEGHVSAIWPYFTITD